MRVSVLLPAREQDPYCVKGAILSLLETAQEPDRVEIVVRLDWNDPKLHAVLDLLNPIPNVRALIGDRGEGYKTLDRQWNECAAVAQGYWLMLWNCDARMMTNGWDTYLDRFTDPICVVQPDDNHRAAAFVIFPRRVQQLLDYITQHPFMDWWINQMIDQNRQGRWPAYADGTIKVFHSWSTRSPFAKESLQLQEDLHHVRQQHWRSLVDQDVLFLMERSA